MLFHIATDLQQVYLEEVFTPQLGKPGASTPTKLKSSSDLDGDGDVDSFEKKVRQLIYDVRHIMKRDKVPAQKAFQMRSSKTNYSQEVIKTAKEKLGIVGGSSTSVSEEVLSEDDKVGIVVNYKNGTTYRKSVSRDSVQTELQKFRSNPNVSSVERTGYGLAKRDYDGDGKVESPSKEHAGAVHNAIQRKKGGVPDGQDTRGKTSKKKLKSYGVSEGFSNWRNDLCEVADELKSKKKTEIKEDPGISNKIIINPEFSEEVEILGGHIVESVELNEEYLNEAVDIATEFFYNCGLNENGVDIVIEELGEETFSEFIFELSEEYLLSEELKKSESKVKTSKAPKGTKQYATTAKRVRTQGGTTMSAKDRIGSTIRKDRVKTAVDKAKETQAPSSEKSPEGQKKGIFGRIKSGIEAHNKATKETGETLKKLGSGISQAWQSVADSKLGKAGRVQVKKGLKRQQKAIEKVAPTIGGAAGRAAARVPAIRDTFKAGQKLRSALGEDFDNWVNDLIEEGYDLSDWTVEELYEEYGYLYEKAESEQQQKLFGLALSVKRGETPRSEASAEVLKIVDTMSEKKIRDFAKTPHSEVPKKKVNEAIARVRPNRRTDTESMQRETRKIQTDNARKKIGEDVDSFATDNPILSTLNVRIARLKAQNDPNKAKQLATLIAQQQRLELEASKKRLRTNTQTLQPQTQNASYNPEGELIDEEMPKKIKQPRQSANPRGTYDPTGIGVYPGRTKEEKQKMLKREPVVKYPPLERKPKPMIDDENPPRRRLYSGSDVD
jgi:hypothetical protein